MQSFGTIAHQLARTDPTRHRECRAVAVHQCERRTLCFKLRRFSMQFSLLLTFSVFKKNIGNFQQIFRIWKIHVTNKFKNCVFFFCHDYRSCILQFQSQSSHTPNMRVTRVWHAAAYTELHEANFEDGAPANVRVG